MLNLSPGRGQYLLFERQYLLFKIQLINFVVQRFVI
jgi:hypothetical protein